MYTPGPKYVRYTGRPNERRGSGIYVTLGRTGIIHLNAKAHALMGRPEAAVLWFDEGAGKIALGPAHAHIADAFPFTLDPHGSARIHAAPFCRDWGIRVAKTEKFIDPQFDDEGGLHLDLKHTTTVGGIKRRTKREMEAGRKQGR